MATSNQTPNFGLSQYAANDPVKFLTNYNEDMVKIDQSSVPNTRKIAGINLQDDILLSELVAAGLAEGTGGAANNALALGGIAAANYPKISSGTWTPVLYGTTTAGNPTYLHNDAQYDIIGKRVHLRARIVITSKGGMSGSILIGGLPFASDLFPITAGGVHGAVSGTSAVPITASVDAASNVISLWKSGGSLILTDTDITDNFAFWSFAFDYYAV